MSDRATRRVPFLTEGGRLPVEYLPNSVEDALGYAQEAEVSAGQASQSATDAAGSATEAASTVSGVEALVGQAESHASSAETSASTAATSANNAAGSAIQAQGSASAASEHVDTAQGYAQTAATEADRSRGEADRAEQAADSAGGSALELSGPGRPDQPATTGQATAVNAASVGTTYISTDGADVGAWVWRKRPGGAWRVVEGDTDWRILIQGGTPRDGVTGTSLELISNGRLRIRRTTAGLWVSYDDLQFGGSGNVRVNLPQGWHIAGDNATFPGGVFNLNGSFTRLDTAQLQLQQVTSATRLRDIKMFPETVQFWPNSLIGS